MASSSVGTVTKPSPRACLSCRNKHLRCNGENPRCARCVESGSECIYVRSRRGMRKDHRRANRASSLSLATVPVTAHCGTALETNSPRYSVSALPETIQPQEIDQPHHSSQTEESGSMLTNYSTGAQDDYLVDIYYRTIHPAHPFLPPYNLYRRDRALLPNILLSAMRYIASHHSPEDSDLYRYQVDAVYQISTPEDGFKVQTLLLLTLASYARFERDVGNKALSMALDVAERINLNSDSFAPNENSVLQESWRRTWWELYTISGLISLISGSNYRLSPPGDILLPTDDEEYERCNVVPTGTIRNMKYRFHAAVNESWSSSAYRVEAMRILNTAQDLAAVSTSEDEAEAVKASIASFLLSLPKDKAEGLSKNGEIDEVMSCALMIVHLAGICVHLGRSDLGDVRGLATVCGNESVRTVANTRTQAHHTACLNSAKALANLITTRSSFHTLSPCFSCAIAFAGVVQLAECRLNPTSHARYLREQLQVELSALKLLSGIWPIANVVRGQLAQFCREVFPVPSALPFLDTMPADITGESWMQDLLTEDLQMPSGSFFIPGMELDLSGQI